ncbi:unnamed protein product, partial [Boreogadus saida]
VWPEVTDPEKFVYEDVAIATYLLVLWGEERAERGVTEKQSFVDLGCGNGLLVHILSNEGHPGKGIDVRKRKIWDMYGPQTCLEEKAITPGEGFLFPATDWLIGNHSDELTPWIPVMAARSSFACRYFVLPCCFFDFYGKFQRRRCGTSQYKEYIDYIAEVSRASGFHTDEDCLRIPSTKRVCLVGKSRSYAPCDAEQAEERRASYIQSRRSSSGSCSGSVVVPPRPAIAADGDGVDHDNGEGPGDGEHGGGGGGCHDNGDPEPAGPPVNDWGAGFQPRERVEKVRNCAALPRDFVDGVVLRVAKALLGLAEDDGPPTPTPAAADVVWNPGETERVSPGPRASPAWTGSVCLERADPASCKAESKSKSNSLIRSLPPTRTLLPYGASEALVGGDRMQVRIAGMIGDETALGARHFSLRAEGGPAAPCTPGKTRKQNHPQKTDS